MVLNAPNPPADPWTSLPAGFTQDEAKAFRSFIGTENARLASLTRATRILVIELDPSSGQRKLAILSGAYQHHTGDILASYGTSKTNCQPVRLGGNVNHGYLSVTWKSNAESLDLIKSPTEEADWTKPDGSPFNADEHGIVTPRPTTTDAAVVVLAPQTMLLPASTPSSFHGRPVDQVFTPEELTTHPEVCAFIARARWTTNNQHLALAPTSTFMNFALIDSTPWANVSATLCVTPTTDIHGITSTEEAFVTYSSYFSSKFVTGTPPTNPNVTTATAGFKEIADHLAKATAKPSISAKEQEALEERMEAALVRRMMAARLVNNSNPSPGTEHLAQVIEVPPITPEYLAAVVKPSSSVSAQKKVRTLWSAASSANNRKLNPTMLESAREFHEVAMTELRIAQERTADFVTESLENEPEAVVNKTSFFLFASPAFSPAEFAQHIENDRTTFTLMSQGEQSSNLSAKSKVHAIKPRIRDRYDFQVAVAGYQAFEELAVGPGSNSQQFSTLVELLLFGLQSVIRSNDSSKWFRFNGECHSAILHIFMDFQGIFKDFAAFAKSPTTLSVARDQLGEKGTIITDVALINRLKTIVQVTQSAFSVTAKNMDGPIPSQWLVWPRVASFLQLSDDGKRKTPPAPVSPDKPGKQPKPADAKTGDAPAKANNNAKNLTDAQKTLYKEKGLLQWKGNGNPRNMTVQIKHKSNNKPPNFACVGHCTKGCFCRFAKCGRVHFSKFADLEPASALALKEYVKDSPDWDFINPADAPSDAAAATNNG